MPMHNIAVAVLRLPEIGLAGQVEEIALLATSLVRWDGCRIMYPNSKMSTDQLINITRSGPKGDTFRVRPGSEEFSCAC